MSEEDKIQLAVMKEKLDSWMVQTEDYRRSLCEKISELKSGQVKIFETLFNLPCKERSEKYKSYDKALTYIKIGVGFAIALIVGHLGWR